MTTIESIQKFLGAALRNADDYASLRRYVKTAEQRLGCVVAKERDVTLRGGDLGLCRPASAPDPWAQEEAKHQERNDADGTSPGLER